MPANKKLGVPKGFAFAPIGDRPEDVPLIPPAPADSAALELGDGVDPPPAKKMRAMPDMAKSEYACFEPIFPGDVMTTDLKCTICCPGDVHCKQTPGRLPRLPEEQVLAC